MEKASTDKGKYKRQKIDTYVSLKDINRLRAICKAYGFRSTYQLLQYLVHCFLRVADPTNDPTNDPIPQEIIDMFTHNADWESQPNTDSRHEGMFVKKKADQRKIKSPDDLTP